jgi:Tfp pilus assembly protein PilV
MVAILILGVALVGLTQGITTALASSKESELQTTAALIAAGQMEALRAEGNIEDTETEGDCGVTLPLYRWRQTIAGAGISGLHEVTVVVESAATGREIYELKMLLFQRPEEASSAPSDKRGGGRQ